MIEDSAEDHDPLDSIDFGEHAGVRTIHVHADSGAALAEQIAMAIGEYATDTDELHLTYATHQVGWQETPGQPGTMLKAGKAPFTQLFFEYSAVIVLRPRMAA